MVAVAERVYTSGHFIVRQVERYGFHTGNIVCGGLGKNSCKVTAAYKFEQYIYLVQFDAHAQIQAVRIFCNRVEVVAGLQSFRGQGQVVAAKLLKSYFRQTGQRMVFVDY